MRLAKDKFKKSEVEVAGETIKQKLLDFIEKNNLRGQINKSDTPPTVYFSTSSTQYTNYYNYNSIPDYNHFIKNEYKIIDDSNKPSHNVNVDYSLKYKFYIDTFKSLNDFEKVVFIKVFSSEFMDRQFFNEINKNLSDKDFWMHLRHVAPFGKGSQSIDYVRAAFTILEQKDINSPEKIESLTYFINYYKTICKRQDIKIGLNKLIYNKINEKYHPILSDLLGGIDVNNQKDLNKILDVTPEIKTLILNKKNIFEQISFKNIPHPNVANYNNYFKCINNFLGSEDGKKLLNIERVDFFELTSSKDPARVFIQATQNGFKEDLFPIYLHLLDSCSHHFTDDYEKKDLMKEVLRKSLNFYLLNKNLNFENLQTPKQTMKI